MSAPAQAWPPQPVLTARRVVAFTGMVFGMFMAILDIQIVSASLAEIQAGLSASAEEISWVQTAYLIAEVIMIPLSGFLGRMISTRYLFAISAAGFTLMSVMCAQASSIEEMIIWRALQGFIGGGMIPSVFSAAFTIFPREKQSIVSPIIGLVATLAPTIGPTAGGYLTDLFSWHWLFLVNVIPGIGVTLAAWFLIDFDKPNWGLFKTFDWWGLAAMAALLGGLEYVLEEGTAKDWFQDEAIRWCALVSMIGGVIFFYRAFTALTPIVDLKAFSNRNFAAGCLASFTIGIGLYGLTYIYPVFLARVRGYTSLEIGETMFLTGVAMFFTAPFAGRLSTKLDPRAMLAMGIFGFAIGTFLASTLTKDWGFHELIWPQIFRGVSLMFCMVPINNVALGTLPPERLKNASGLFNLTRNLGGAVGLALINTLMNERWDFHLHNLREKIIWGRQVADETLANITQGFSTLGDGAALAATKQLSLLARREALVLALGDVFLALTLIFLLMLIVLPAIKRANPARGGGEH
ncbi:MAG: DHA2 family efflux MFS transporter permease subunit [Alphaproteobacteria bacterium]|jgi:DHA2 family multidrug resistance protein|nr:DHA2 family efflux MFS transporter permease subunit [Alphaproteobacteria bacterium]